MSSDFYAGIAGEIADEGEPIGQYWPDDEAECSICFETLADCTCLDGLRPAETGGDPVPSQAKEDLAMGTNYYVKLPECENPCIHCKGPELIHLGKSSGGWTFTFRAYPQWEDSDQSELGRGWIVTDFVSWLKLLDLGPIEDEYGRAVTKDDMLAKVEAKRGGHSELSGHDYYDAGGNRFVPGDFC